MSTYHTIVGEIQYPSQAAYEQAVALLSRGGWLDPEGCLVDETGERVSQENAEPEASAATRTLRFPQASYRNLGRHLSDLFLGGQGRVLWTSTDGAFEAGLIEDGVETPFDLNDWARKNMPAGSNKPPDLNEDWDVFLGWRDAVVEAFLADRPAEEKSTLSLEVRFNPNVTDAESLATALDGLLEMALSTPGILDEYGRPGIGPFYVCVAPPPAPAAANRRPETSTMVLNIHGGGLQDVFCSDPGIKTVVVDWDTEGASSGDPGIYEIEIWPGANRLVVVVEFPVAALEDLEGTDCEEAIKAAGIQLDNGSPSDDRCECELPGYFCSGIPGILAHREYGRLAPGAKVERCDLCERYPSDEAAFQKLGELGIAHGSGTQDQG